MTELFQGTKQNISLHIKNILEEGELLEQATVKGYLTVQNEGPREVKRGLEALEELSAKLKLNKQSQNPHSSSSSRRRGSRTIRQPLDSRLRGNDEI